MLATLISLLVISISLNLYQFFKPKKPIEKSLEAKQLLSDLINGSALVKIEVIDPTNLLYRSPN